MCIVQQETKLLQLFLFQTLEVQSKNVNVFCLLHYILQVQNIPWLKSVLNVIEPMAYHMHTKLQIGSSIFGELLKLNHVKNFPLNFKQLYTMQIKMKTIAGLPVICCIEQIPFLCKKIVNFTIWPFHLTLTCPSPKQNLNWLLSYGQMALTIDFEI